MTLESIALDFPHGFSMPDFGIRKDLSPGKPVELNLVADRTGRFHYLCDNSCGDGHAGRAATSSLSTAEHRLHDQARATYLTVDPHASTPNNQARVIEIVRFRLQVTRRKVLVAGPLGVPIDAIAIAWGASAATLARAQEPVPLAEATRIVVTGSRIPRVDSATALPVQVIGRSERPRIRDWRAPICGAWATATRWCCSMAVALPTMPS